MNLRTQIELNRWSAFCDLQSVWPDSAIFCILGNFLKPLATINLPKSLTFLGNICKGVKIYHFSSEIILRELLQTFGDFYLVTLLAIFVHLTEYICHVTFL